MILLTTAVEHQWWQCFGLFLVLVPHRSGRCSTWRVPGHMCVSLVPMAFQLCLPPLDQVLSSMASWRQMSRAALYSLALLCCCLTLQRVEGAREELGLGLLRKKPERAAYTLWAQYFYLFFPPSTKD